MDSVLFFNPAPNLPKLDINQESLENLHNWKQ